MLIFFKDAGQSCDKIALNLLLFIFYLYTEFDEILHNLSSFFNGIWLASPVHPILWIQQLYEAAPVLLPDCFFCMV